jgi:hypothetical protein
MEEIVQDTQHCAADNRLFERYRGHLSERGVAQLAQAPLVAIAQQFIQWWRQSIGGEQFTIVRQRHHQAAMPVEWIELRETYLRITCPDHQLRCTRRTDLTEFLGYLAGSR